MKLTNNIYLPEWFYSNNLEEYLILKDFFQHL